MRETSPKSTPKDSTYSLLLQVETKGTLNASYRIPYYSSTKGDAKELHTVALGSIFDCVAREAGVGVSLECGFESSFASTRPQPHLPTGFPPTIQSRKVHATAVLPFGIEIAMAELHDPTTGSQLQFLVSVEQLSGTDPAAKGSR
jgi:hypothetical protein